MTKTDLQNMAFLAQEATQDAVIIETLQKFQTTLEDLWDTMYCIQKVIKAETKSQNEVVDKYVRALLETVRDRMARNFGEEGYFDECRHEVTEDIDLNHERCINCKKVFQG